MNLSPEKISSQSEVYNTSNSEVSEFSSDAECFPKLDIKPNILLECGTMNSSPTEATSATAECDYSEIHKSVYGNEPNRKTENSGSEISSSEEPKIENTKESDSQFEKKCIGITKSSGKEVLDPSQEKQVSSIEGAASEARDTATGSSVAVEKDEDSIKFLAPEALMLEYMNKYASEYSKELLFAVDLVLLVRLLNKLKTRYIIYGPSGNAPVSPCGDTLDQALCKMWESMKNDYGRLIESQMEENKGMDFKSFQCMMLHIAEAEDCSKWRDEKTFLTYCLLFAQYAVCAEKNGIKDACEFIPLVICRIIQNLKNSKKFPVDFWEKIANLALDITERSEREK